MSCAGWDHKIVLAWNFLRFVTKIMLFFFLLIIYNFFIVVVVEVEAWFALLWPALRVRAPSTFFYMNNIVTEW